MLLAEADGRGVMLVETRESLLALGLGIVTSLRHRRPSMSRSHGYPKLSDPAVPDDAEFGQRIAVENTV